MMTVRFATGFSIQYNTANFALRESSYTDLYTDATKKHWVAQVPNDAVIEFVPAIMPDRFDDLLRPRKRIIKSDPYDQPGANALEFHLSYDGILLGSGGAKSHASHKHDIRKYFHRQLKRLWEINPSSLQKLSYWSAVTSPFVPDYSVKEDIANKYPLGKYRFLPLATRERDLAARLDILFLRYDQPGSALIQSGDIDNRLKTLFDALRKPHNLPEAPGDPTPDEDPFCVLLEDDSLITHLSVTTGLLLEPNKDVNEVRLIITVNMEPVIINAYNLAFK